MPVGALLMGGGNLLSAFGTYSGGEADERIGKYNAAQERQDAQLELEQAAVDETRQRALSYKQLSSMRAGYGASGVTMEGSPLDVLEESSANAELDALLIRHGGAVRAQRHRAAAALAEYEGKARKHAATLSAGGQLLSGGGNILGGLG